MSDKDKLLELPGVVDVVEGCKPGDVDFTIIYSDGFEMGNEVIKEMCDRRTFYYVPECVWNYNVAYGE